MTRTLSLLLAATALSITLIACGTAPAGHESHVMGEPDFKTADGVRLMDWIKKPANARSVCQTLTQLKAKGFDAYSSQATDTISRQFNLHPTEAEIVNTYVVEFNCPENR